MIKQTKPAAKQCPHCNGVKVFDLFHKDKNSKDGRTSWCKACTKEYNIAYTLRKKAEKKKTFKNEAKERSDAIDKETERVEKSLKGVKEANVKAGFTPIEKMCKQCADDKPFSEFFKSKKSKDGHDGTCKACRKAARAAKKAQDFDL